MITNSNSRFALTQIFLDRTRMDEVTTTYMVKAGGYRYGFNGMEKDDEVKGKGNSYDFGARMYDARLGRWLTIDPLAGKYPNLSPYNFTGNNPILFVDVDGKDFGILIDHTTKTIVITANFYVINEKTKEEANVAKNQWEALNGSVVCIGDREFTVSFDIKVQIA